MRMAWERMGRCWTCTHWRRTQDGYCVVGHAAHRYPTGNVYTYADWGCREWQFRSKALKGCPNSAQLREVL